MCSRWAWCLYELLALEPLFHEDITQLAIDEVAVLPTPNIRTRIPGSTPSSSTSSRLRSARIPRSARQRRLWATISIAWCAAQEHVPSPDLLHDHLAKLFPTTYQPLTQQPAERTSFSNLKKSARRAVAGSASDGNGRLKTRTPWLVRAIRGRGRF